jgi:hypothetical protein
MTGQNPKSKVHPHPLRLDPDVPPDVHGRGTCRCGLPDLPDDPRHTMPARPAEADARELAAGESWGAE